LGVFVSDHPQTMQTAVPHVGAHHQIHAKALLGVADGGRERNRP
jgi:hypothetical protein